MIRQRGTYYNDDARTQLIKTANLRAPLVNSLSKTAGYGPATFTRTSAGWSFDDEGKLIQVPSGAARFYGARLNANILPANAFSENVSGSGWSKTSVTVSGDSTVVSTPSTDRQRISATIGTLNYASSLYFSARFTYTNHQFVQILFNWTAGSPGYCNVDILNGTIFLGGGAIGGISQVSNGVYDVWLKTDYSMTLSAVVQIQFATSLGNGWAASFTGDGVKSFGVTRIHVADVTGKTLTALLPYVSKGAWDKNKNFLTYTNDFSNSVWLKTNVNVTQNSIANPINGVVDAWKAEVATTAAANFYQESIGSGYSGGMNCGVYAKKGSGATEFNYFVLRNVTTSTNIIVFSLNYDTGVVTYTTGSTGVTVTDAGNGWWKISIVSESGFNNNDTARFNIGVSGASETTGEYAYFYLPHMGRGIVLPTSHQYVGASWDIFRSGTDGVRWFGTTKNDVAMPDSTLKGFLSEPERTNNLLWSRDMAGGTYAELNNNSTVKAWIPTTTGSNIITNGTFDTDLTGWTAVSGGAWNAGAMRLDGTSAACGRYQDVSLTVGKTYLITCDITIISGSSTAGLYIYENNSFGVLQKIQATTATTSCGILFTAKNATQRIYCYSSTGRVADFDNIVLKETTCSPTRTATGLCGCANAATRLTASGSDAVIYQPISMASAARSSSAYVKRVSGTGPIYFGRWASAGAQVWTDITSLINSNTYTKVVIEDSSVLDPAIGFKIATSGDVIDVDCVQDESGAFASSPIITSTAAVTRTQDTLKFQQAGNVGFSDGSGYLEWSVMSDYSSYRSSIGTPLFVDSAGRIAYGPNGNAITTASSYDGVNTVSSTGGSSRGSLMNRKQATTWTGIALKTKIEGASSITSGSFDGSMGSTQSVDVGGSAIGFGGTVKNIALWTSAISDANVNTLV